MAFDVGNMVRAMRIVTVGELDGFAHGRSLVQFAWPRGEGREARNLIGEAASFANKKRLYEHRLKCLGRDRCAMRQRWTGRSGVLLILLAAMCGVIARGQDGTFGGQGDGRVAFAGGQMVRGTVTAATADHLTVKTETGEVYQVAASANTRVMKDRQPVKLTDIKAGDAVGAMGVMDAPSKTIHAVFVGVVDAEQVRKAREDLGKSYITGKVTAVDMDALKITVQRPDGVSQVIGVDEGTSFRRGGRRMAALVNGSGPVETAGPNAPADTESITLADVKVGDRVAGRGGLKNGVFVPVELGVFDPAKMGQGRRRGANGSGAIGSVGSSATENASH